MRSKAFSWSARVTAKHPSNSRVAAASHSQARGAPAAPMTSFHRASPTSLSGALPAEDPRWSKA
eukprot:11065512-Lingulodinium_polyedra.AAC.1